MKLLILGSSGQIGSALVDYLTLVGHEVLTFDIEEDKQQDLRVPFSAEEKIKQSDFVYFLAFDVGGSKYLQKYQNTYEFIDNNIKIMSNVFDCIKKYNKPFIFASSQMSNMHHSSYGILKAVGELYTKSLNGLIVKFWNVYGIEKDLNKSHVVTDFILSAKNNKRIDMLTDGQEERQMLYVDDCCECLEILTKKYEHVSREETLHISSFVWTKIIDIANEISTFYPNTIIIPNSNKDIVQLNTRNDPNSDILKYWKPKITLREGIKKIINKLQQNNI